MSGKRPASVPVILQMEAQDAGAACLAMVLAYYKKWLRLDEVRRVCDVSRDGTPVEFLAQGARDLGLVCDIEELLPEDLQQGAPLPLIATWGNGQYVVVCACNAKGVFVNHPSKGRARLTWEEFEAGYGGRCLLLAPSDDFVAEGKRPWTADLIRDFARSNGQAVCLLVVTGLLATCGGLVLPSFSRIFADEVLPGDRAKWYPAILYAFAAVIAFELVSGAINQALLISSKGKMSAVNNATFMRKIFRLPMEFYLRWKAGDLAQRQELNETIAQTFVGNVVPQLIDMVLLELYVAAMLSYSAPLTVVGVVALVANFLLMSRIGRMRKRMNGVYYGCKANLDAATISGIDMVETIKATGSEGAYFQRWSGFHARMINAQVDTVRATKYLANLPALITALSQDVVMFAGFYLIIRGDFSVGITLTFFQLMKALATPVSELLDAQESIEAVGAAIERVADVVDYPEDEGLATDELPLDYDAANKLSGHIELRNVSFGYSRVTGPVVRDFSLTLTPGKRVAIVGGSGSGKSTVAKLIAGLNKPWAGQILYDGQSMEHMPRVLFRSSVAMVDQEISLFNDTIADNIKMWDATIADYDMVLAANDAGIHEQITRRNGGYYLTLDPGGRNLSGGERQRLEIARVLAGEPTILIMDEATSALDAQAEYEISESIRRRGITCVIVAHRLSTVCDCDEIVVLDHGEVVERGTHDELMCADGLYRRLIMTA